MFMFEKGERRTERDFDFKSFIDGFTLRRIQLRETPREQFLKDLSKVAIDFRPRLKQGFLLILIERDDRLLDLLLIPNNRLHHILQRNLFLLHAVDHVHHLGVDLLLHALEALGQVAQ